MDKNSFGLTYHLGENRFPRYYGWALVEWRAGSSLDLLASCPTNMRQCMLKSAREDVSEILVW